MCHTGDLGSSYTPPKFDLHWELPATRIINDFGSDHLLAVMVSAYRGHFACLVNYASPDREPGSASGLVRGLEHAFALTNGVMEPTGELV